MLCELSRKNISASLYFCRVPWVVGVDYEQIETVSTYGCPFRVPLTLS